VTEKHTEKQEQLNADEHWRIYRGVGVPHDGIDRLPEPPPWRRFGGKPLLRPKFGQDAAGNRYLGAPERAMAYRADPHVVEMVNVALYLRRPLLVTGKPGTGKSTLAYSIAYELGLGPVLNWPITSRSTLRDGLYRYDAIGRLQEAGLQQATAGARASAGTGQQASAGPAPVTAPDIGRYIQLGPLGTALLPQARPRVLLIDELDKSDIDLPNDLLNVFEEGSFGIQELARLPDDQRIVHVGTTDVDRRVPVEAGSVRCATFPITVITSNGEREFPPAFLRRCVRLLIEPPDHQRLAGIVEAHLGKDAETANTDLIREFLSRRERGDLATDQLLNAIYLATSGSRPPATTLQELTDVILRPLDATTSG
jgi:MoxR-like ATPase